MNKTYLLRNLILHNCLQFGSFTLKSGQISPYYLDLRKIISSPYLLSDIADAYISILNGISFNRIAAIPLAALPIASIVSIKMSIPFIYPRLIIKEHGTGNSIEGDFSPEDEIVLLDDVISTASSKLEAISILKKEGINITDLVVLVDRESGGSEEMELHGVHCHSYAKISELLKFSSDSL